jgi:hypothetical protein
MSPPIPEVGDQDPTERNSPIASEEDFETGSVGADDVPDERVCFYNAVDYPHGSYVKSGTAILRCEGGVWVEAGPADSDNP